MTEDDDNPMFWSESHDGLLNALVLLRFCEMLFRVVLAGNKVLVKALNVLARLEVVDGFICCNSVKPAEEFACPVSGIGVCPCKRCPENSQVSRLLRGQARAVFVPQSVSSDSRTQAR